MWLLLMLACGGPPQAEEPRPRAPADVKRISADREAVRPDDPANPLTPALQKIYDTAPCLGPMSKVRVYRDAAAQVTALYYLGDHGQCSHPPAVYYTPDGVEREPVAMKPITDENRAMFEAIHERGRAGGTLAETLYFE
ncbi:MAG: hypothetical protein EP330_00670 [Deltaproteobacteria bacterium]|nr:MAG: hypothetical protein EP330_00670 [Deltaproteobacteria bacterium]